MKHYAASPTQFFLLGWLVVAALTLVTSPRAIAADEPALLDIERKVSHGYATNDGVRMHYARLGEGPRMVVSHCFPKRPIRCAARAVPDHCFPLRHNTRQ